MRQSGCLVDRLQQKCLARLFVDHLPCCDVEHKTRGVAVLLSLNALFLLVGGLSGLAFGCHFAGSWVVLGNRLAVAALQTVSKARLTD